VDYKNLRSEELGSIYEALLELHPEINAEAKEFNLSSASGNERKTTGSYYTPDSLVQCLLDSALDPVVDEAIKQNDPEKAILNLKVCDPACGSGHFLIAAAHRMAKRLAAIRTGDEEPSPKAVRTALRDVIGHCIYGVDINPMAVELCKVSLWMESLEPGKPLTFLEHRIQPGNALIGATPALLKKGIPDEAFKPIEGDDKDVCSEYKKQNKKERAGFQNLPFEPFVKLGSLAASIAELDAIDDADIAGVHAKQQRYEELVKSSGYLYGRFLADAWCAAFVWKKTRELPFPITEAVFREIEQNPYRHATGHDGGWLEREVKRLHGQYQFFHWHLAFPDVFRALVNEEEPESVQAGWSGGFDVLLGNPPWERIKLQDKEWFAIRQPEIASAANAAARQRLITALQKEDSVLYQAFMDDRRKAEGESHFVRSSERYPLCGRGTINTYAIFAETNRLIINAKGYVGCIVPSGIATDDLTKLFFQALMKSQSLTSLYDFENREGLFPAVDSRMKFCLLTLTGEQKHVGQGADFVFFAHNVENLREEWRHFRLTAEDIARLSPESLTCPIFRSKRDAELTRSIYLRADANGLEQGEWAGRYIRLMDFSDHSEMILAEEHLEDGTFDKLFEYISTQGSYVRLYEAKLFHLFNHRYATFEGVSQAEAYDGSAREVILDEFCDPGFVIKPRYWVSADLFKRIIARYSSQKGYLLAYREITNTTNERTCISTIIPETAVMRNTVSCLGVGASSGRILLQANLSAICFDYAARQKVAGTHLSYGIMKQLPFLPPSIYQSQARWLRSETNRDWIVSRALELTYTAYDLLAFAADCGYDGEPFRWNEPRRFLLRSELDAAYFHLYGIGREDVDYILDTFPIVRRKDEARHGEFRTKRVILEIYDAMQQAITRGEPYQTRLDPPPANGWTPPEIEEDGETERQRDGERERGSASPEFRLRQEDARPQPGLFDKAE
jgi:hypothetical protein